MPKPTTPAGIDTKQEALDFEGLLCFTSFVRVHVGGRSDFRLPASDFPVY